MITILTSQDNGYDLSFTDEQMQEEACRLVDEFLGENDKEWDELCQCLAITDYDLGYLQDLYVSNRKKWLEIIEARAQMFWADKILDNLIKGESNV